MPAQPSGPQNWWSPVCSHLFLLLLAWNQNFKKYRVIRGNVKVFLGPLGGRGEEETCCAEFPAHEVDWGLRKPLLPWLAQAQTYSQGKLTLSTASLGPHLHGREMKGLSLYPGSWTNCSFSEAQSFPIREQLNMRVNSVCCPPRKQTLELPVLQTLATLDHCLPKSLQKSPNPTISLDSCNCTPT